MNGETTWSLNRISLPESLRGLGHLGPVTFLQGQLITVASGNVYVLTLDTDKDAVRIKADLLGPIGRVKIKGFDFDGFQGAESTKTSAGGGPSPQPV